LKILIIEPFFSGSHKVWADEYVKFSKHNVEIISLPGRFWKWRMHGGAVSLAKKYQANGHKPDLILATDMLNLPVFQSLVKPNCPVCIYFHENQLTYPWSNRDKDIELQRDKHYGFINYSSALSSDHIYFNSQFHLNSFFAGLEEFLKQFPDYREIHYIDSIREKSSVLHLGMDLKKFDLYKPDRQKHRSPIILWNHRWENDKNPETFFNALEKLSYQGIDFQLAVLGQEFKNENSYFTKARKNLKKHIVQFGFTSTFEEYARWLWEADILPVTSIQDFFGISIMEAVYCETIPLLPRRLSYQKLFQEKEYPQLFYENNSDLLEKLITSIHNISSLRQKKYQSIASDYDWSNMVTEYDREFEKYMT
jgi:glycosyltransferase involved in cell wall biosynthesis